MSFGKFIRKASHSIGKGIGKVEQGNRWLGKNISNVERNYSTFKHKAIQGTPAPLRGLTRDSFYAVEHNPITSAVVEAKDLVKLGQQNVKDLTDSTKLLRKFMN